MAPFPRASVAAALLLSLPVLAFFAGRPAPLPAAEFTFVLPKESATVDPALATSVADGWVVAALFEGLLRLDPTTLRPLPGAARSWSASADGLHWAFEIDPAARWSDGERVKAGDFAYAWARALDPATGSPNAAFFRPIAGAAAAVDGRAPKRDLGVVARDDDHLDVELEAPCTWFPLLVAHFAFSPVRRDVIDRCGPSWTEPEHLVGNGAYRLALRRVRDRLRFVVNEHHPRAAAIDLRVIDALAVDSKATGVNLFLTGAADWVNAIPSVSIPHLADRPELLLSTNLGTIFVRMNVTRPPLDDVRVRRALELAIDRAALCRYIYRGGEQPARSLVPPALPGYAPAQGAPEDVATARALLAAAGFPDGRGLPEIELLHPTDETARAAAEAIAARLQEVLHVPLRPMPQEFKVFIDSQKSLKYQLCLANWIGDYPDASNFLALFRSTSGNNRCGWKDAEYDRLLDAADREPDAIRRAAALARAEARLLSEGPIAPICYRGQANLVSRAIEGFSGNLLDLHPLDLLRRRR